MDYPSQLTLDPEVREQLTQWVDTELTNHLSERDSWIQDMNNLERDYIAKPSEDRPSFPFVGASNLIIPFTAITFEATLARTMQRFYALKQRVSVNGKDPAIKDLISEIEIYFDDEIVVQGDAIENLKPAIMQQVLLGTGVAKATFEKVCKKGMRNGKPFEVVIKEGSVIKSVPVTNFLMPFDCVDPQTARWCGEVFWLNPYQIPQLENDGFFAEGTTENLRQYFLSQQPSTSALYTTQSEETLESREPTYPIRIEFFKIQTQFCVSKVSKELQAQASRVMNLPFDTEERFDEIELIFHKDSRTIVSINYNPYEDLRREYECVNYFELPFRWAGIGIGQQAKVFQEEITTQHRQIIDAGTLANTRMWKARRGNTSIKDDEPIYNNKIWWVDEMDDIQAFENNEIYGSAFNMENQANIYGQQRTGVNELTLGMPGVGTPGTATDSMNRIQESARKGDYVWGNTKRFTSKLFFQSVLNQRQWGLNLERLSLSPKGADIELMFKRPYEDFRKKLIIDVQLVDQNDNMMLDRQTQTQLSGAAQQYYTNLMPILQQLSAPQPVPPMLFEGFRQVIRGANIIFTKILETYGVRKPDDYLIAVPPPLPSQPTQPNVPNPEAFGQPNAGPSIPTPINPITNYNFNSSDVQGGIPQGLAGLLAGGR